MSQNRNTNVTQTFIVEAIDDATFSACTGIYTNAIESCFGDVIYIGSDISSVGDYSGTSIYANTFYSGGTIHLCLGRKSRQLSLSHIRNLTVHRQSPFPAG